MKIINLMEGYTIGSTIKDINDEYDGLYDIHVELIDGKITFIDDCEELYYGGCNFDSVLEKIESAVRHDFGDSAYLDCECPGRWVVVY